MLAFLKRNIFISIIFILTLAVSFLTFLTFIDKSFNFLSKINLNYLLLSNICLLLIFFLIIFIEIKNSIKNNISVRGSIANRKYIIFFSLFTLIPSLLISIFSLFLFSFALEKYFDSKITLAVNNSYKLARDYVDEKRNKIESDIILVSFDLGKNIKYLSTNKEVLQNFLNTQRILRGLDQIYLLDINKKIILSSPPNIKTQIEDKAFNMVQNDNRPLKIINAFENKSAAIIKVQSTKDIFLYVIKFLDEDISNYLKESEEAVNFYYTVGDQRTGIRISFALIYIIIVTLLLFLSITIAIRFSSRFFISINNLISASSEIGKGNLNTKVPEVKADLEMERLNKNFNAMVEKLKFQQDKLLNSERHEAWESVARKLAHEIKNPLTPIQLTIDNLKSKYSDEINKINRDKYNSNLQTILKQIKQIETLVNEFSDFARMPKPLLKKNNIIEVVNNNIEILKNISKDIFINFNLKNHKSLMFMFDNEQISRVFFNLIKNSIESIKEKSIKSTDFDKIIDIEIIERKDYININLSDTGIGFLKNNAKQLIKPYFTTKVKGSGLGLSIVNKIINDHDGKINFMNTKVGAKIEIQLPK
jgi:two-component system nitrogen regulation sensor histidine kinase NtrY|tara:strand:- start:196 stop:1968 length:1773 start_codon:yes stop_codon:yes gene_type:complete